MLGILFYRFISENITDYINKLQQESGIADYDYTKETDDNAETARDYAVSTKGFFVLPSELFQNVQKKAKNNPNVDKAKLGKAVEMLNNIDHIFEQYASYC